MKRSNKRLGKEYRLLTVNLKMNNEWITRPLKNSLIFLKTLHYKYYKEHAKKKNKIQKHVNIQYKLGNLKES